MIAIVLGTRPEIIKMSPIIRYCEEHSIDYFVVHTNQHYSYEMDKVFFEELNLAEAKYNLGIGSASQGRQTGMMLGGIEDVFEKNAPDIVLVEGDTNTVLAGALAASKMHIPVGHVEAGLRSYDRRMPEEINRVLTDHISDYLFAPTEISKENLEREGVLNGVHVVGNTIVDATYQNLKIASKRSMVLEELGLDGDDYFLITLHRAENVDDKETLNRILTAFNQLSDTYGVQLVFPIHPRTRKMIDRFGLGSMLDCMMTIEPVGYLDFLILEKSAKLILTDSGGVQEEACILSVPCVTLRDNTERPETVNAGKSVLAGSDPDSIVRCAEEMLGRKLSDENPFGDGMAGAHIMKILKYD
ncbi:MAG: UDP-N-acetylglucosamine 2-epimerase (non-hydrolyzing) [Euryarchaeota archaeon]|nr:UDP-N-acetylglucosamine 2-epimerase (non-hydrolyzing) [Euryarchaeota archaeon]